jgi:hypothetical protein
MTNIQMLTIKFALETDAEDWTCSVCGKLTPTALLVLSELDASTLIQTVEPVCDDCATTYTLQECLDRMLDVDTHGHATLPMGVVEQESASE